MGAELCLAKPPCYLSLQGCETTIRVVSMDRDYHVECYHCEVGPLIPLGVWLPSCLDSWAHVTHDSSSASLPASHFPGIYLILVLCGSWRDSGIKDIITNPIFPGGGGDKVQAGSLQVVDATEGLVRTRAP